MTASRAHEQGSVVNTKFGARPIIDLPSFALGNGGNIGTSNLADVPPRLFGPTEYSYNVGRNVPRNHSQGGYVGQYYTVPNHGSPRGYPNSPRSNIVQESNVVPYPSYTTVPNMAVQQYSNPSQGNVVQYNSNQNRGSENEVHNFYGPNGERLPGPPASFVKPKLQYSPERQRFPMNFKIEGTLEYGKMVSIRILHGNVSFRDIPNFVLTDCLKTYRVIPKTDVTIVAENGEYNVFATPNLQAPLTRHAGYMYDPYNRHENERRATVYPRTISPHRYRPDHDIYTKKYDDYVHDDRRHTSHNYRERQYRDVPSRHWYSSGAISVEHRKAVMEETGFRDPQRKPLPMKEMDKNKRTG